VGDQIELNELIVQVIGKVAMSCWDSLKVENIPLPLTPSREGRGDCSSPLAGEVRWGGMTILFFSV
jgi:hypothetical protein